MRLISLHCEETGSIARDNFPAGGTGKAIFRAVNKCRIAGLRVHESSSFLLFRFQTSHRTTDWFWGFHWVTDRIPSESLDILVNNNEIFIVEVENPKPHNQVVIADLVLDQGDLNYNIPGVELVSVWK